MVLMSSGVLCRSHWWAKAERLGISWFCFELEQIRDQIAQQIWGAPQEAKWPWICSNSKQNQDIHCCSAFAHQFEWLASGIPGLSFRTPDGPWVLYTCSIRHAWSERNSGKEELDNQQSGRRSGVIFAGPIFVPTQYSAILKWRKLHHAWRAFAHQMHS